MNEFTSSRYTKLLIHTVQGNIQQTNVFIISGNQDMIVLTAIWNTQPDLAV